MTQLKVLICGGGIAGNALAFWLSKLNHDVTVVERFPSLRTTGLQIDLRGAGIEVMKRMGLEEAFRARSVDEQGLKVVDSSDRTWAYFKANKTGKGLQSFTSDFEILRGDLCQLIHDATDDRAKYMFGTTIVSYEEKNDCIEVLFSDGHTDRFDLLVGADGQGSRTRKLMAGPETVDPLHYLGLYIGYFTIPRPIQEVEGYEAKMYTAPGRRSILMRRHNPTQVQVYLQVSGKHNSGRLLKAHEGGATEEKKAMAEIFRGAGWHTEEILKGLEESQDFYCERLGVVKMDSWSSGRVVLVGDAAYCPSASTGMGTTSGIVGAYILAGEIGKHCWGTGTKEDLPMALKAYDDRFRPFMDQVQHGIVESAPLWQKIFPSTSVGIAILNVLLAIAAVLRLNVLGRWILREGVKDWNLPDYEEMVHGRRE
ncbi:hypothetical protein VP1G_02336 [Cytospora mali]|uniref:FAD-binding domain-containing protein n=1 Tax=Cytospora mali TaxID=578113 RepID=A0A194UTN8_CYTMA|nr:hypothetical protein VP1G_02336 [Valsa mali var. pyri (nom. inval.)]